MNWIAVLLLLGGGFFAMTFLPDRGPTVAPIMVGGVEQVLLMPWKVSVSARIDTGATTSALDARDIKLVPGTDEIEFRLPERCGGFLVRRRLLGWRTVRTSDGATERRPAVEMAFCMGREQFRTEVTLGDRSKMTHPLLIGRRTLGGRYVVDVKQSNLLPPDCPESLVPTP